MSCMGGVRWQVAGETDIGGSNENQDEMFIWQRKQLGLCVIGVLDGHGRDVGRTAASAGSEYLKMYFDKHHLELFSSPVQCLEQAFIEAHDHIKLAFKYVLNSHGWEVSENNGYLIKRKDRNQRNWQCVHGGTSCSIVALVGSMIYTANVGDSTATLCCTQPYLTDELIHKVCDTAISSLNSPNAEDEQRNRTQSLTPLSPLNAQKEGEKTIVLTAEHSPETVEEFERLRLFKCSDTDPLQPSMLVIYDAQIPDKSKCPSVMSVDETGVPTVTNRGMYYKSVRNEWASLVAAPSTACYADALAFTRSLGDYHLHTYGVSHLPEIRKMDLKQVLLSMNTYKTQSFDLQGIEESLDASEYACSNGNPKKQKQDHDCGAGGTSEEAEGSMTDSTLSDNTRTRSETNSSLFSSTNSASTATSGTSINTSTTATSCTPKDGAPAEASESCLCCIVLASDGVWDNWHYNDVARFVMDASCLKVIKPGFSTTPSTLTTPFAPPTAPTTPATARAVDPMPPMIPSTKPDGCTRVAQSFLGRNAIYAKRNFGPQADNATGIVLYMEVPV